MQDRNFSTLLSFNVSDRMDKYP